MLFGDYTVDPASVVTKLDVHKFQGHINKFMTSLDCIVNNLDDQSIVEPMIKELGTKHASLYNVKVKTLPVRLHWNNIILGIVNTYGLVGEGRLKCSVMVKLFMPPPPTNAVNLFAALPQKYVKMFTAHPNCMVMP